MASLSSNIDSISTIEQSNLLQTLISPKDVVLDLGSFASGTTQALLSRRCRCYVEDLPLFLNEIEIDDQFNFETALRRHLVVANDDVKINVILTWDLFHYLDLSEIRALFKILENKVIPGTIVHSTRYMGQDIPERPQLFKLSEDLSYKMLEKKSSLKVPNYSHATIDLLTELKHFNLNDTLTHSKRFSKGLVEYSLVHSGAAVKMKPVRPVFVDLEQPSNQNNYRSIKLPNLTKLLNQQSQQPNECIADFGRAHCSNFESLDRTAKIVLHEDLYSAMLWQRKTYGDETTASTEGLFSFRGAVKLDLVLLWDIVNFCSPTQLQQIILKLSQHLTPGALVHCVLPHSGQAALEPANFRIKDSFDVVFAGKLNSQAGQQVITTGQLVRLLPGFKVAAYYFGVQPDSTNYQEYLFEYIGVESKRTSNA